jgi:hypothetical protein
MYCRHMVTHTRPSPRTAASCAVLALSLTMSVLAIWPQDAEPWSLLLAALAPCKQVAELRVLSRCIVPKPLLQTQSHTECF